MASCTSESVEQHLEPMKNKKWVLRVSFHCEGCKKKVKKILSRVPGVHEMEFDIKQQKVIVIGDVEADALLKRLKKYGKHAVLLPENFLHTDTEKKAGKLEEKLLPKEETSWNDAAADNNDKEAAAKPDAAASQEPPVSKDSQVDGTSGTAGAHEPKPDAQSDIVLKVIPQDTKAQSEDKVLEEAKSEVKAPDTSSAVGEPPTEVENEGGHGNDGDKVSSDSKVESAKISKKKKNKGQNGNTALDDPALIAATADRGGLQTHDTGPQAPFFPANHYGPRQHGYYDYQSNFYYPPHVQAVSYDMAYPSSNSTTSYYEVPPPNSHVYSYYAPEAESLPSDVESYPRQPLDSLEMFSDENPNGCVII